MKIYYNLDQFKNVNNPVLTTGTFDGVHLGHKKILRQLRLAADQVGGESVLFTFEPHPRMILFPDAHNLKLLNLKEEKIKQLERAGLEHLIIFPFSLEFSRLTATEFVRDVLVNQLKIKKLIIGYDHHFGRNREGSIENLKELSPLYDFEFEEIPVQVLDDVSISSTKIRRSIELGDIVSANRFLGYNYGITGQVVEGNKLGRQIGFPTANLIIESNLKLTPGFGVYVIKANLNGVEYNGMLNIGNKPTVNENGDLSLEAHLFDYSGENFYGEMLEIELINRIRDEKKFNSIDDLKLQLEKDKIEAQRLLND